MPADLKYRKILRQLSAEISDGKYESSGRLPSESQLCQRYKVSRPTVIRALRDLQTAGLIERRAGAGSFLTGKSASSAKGYHQLALLVPRAGLTEIFEVVCGELASLARASNCSLLWGSSLHSRPEIDIDPREVDQICEQFIERSVSGVFFAPFELRSGTESISQNIAVRLRQAGIAVILLDRDFKSYPVRSDFDLVGLDNFAAGYLLGQHLIKLGLKRIRFVAMKFSAPTIDARIAGARAALEAEAIEVGRDFVHWGNPAETAFIRNLLAAEKVDAIICGNDLTATQLMNTLAKLKMRVPEDVRVVGCDDQRYAQLMREPLTTIHQPCRDIATVAMKAMLDRIADPALPTRTLLLNPKLVVRSSCGAYLH
jgi:DNA-binding LacI/PurR family transcriptional regulator